MHRWRWIVLLVCGWIEAILAPLGGTAGAAEKPPSAERPNIVVIISDDQAWTDYSFMGHPHVRTPHIDRLARESLTFRRGYVTSSLCCPSLASIITGLYPHQHKVTSNDPPMPQGMTPAEFSKSPDFQSGREAMTRHLEAVPTMPRALKEQGYLSLQTGKWWQGHYSRGGFTHGMTQGQRHGDRGLDIGRKTMQPIYDFVELARTEHQPFFLWYAPMMPHDPHTPPERLLQKYQAQTPSPHVARYWAMIEWFDETVGELLFHLDENHLANDTIVIFLADNGWIQNPEQDRYAPKSKQSPYDGGLRTPIMLRWPAKVQPRMSAALASSIDLMPTLLAALGQPRTSALQGVDLLDPQAVENRKAIFGECFTHTAVDLERPAASLRWRWTIAGSWKLMVPDATNEPGQRAQLYDLCQDPREATDLAAQQPEIVARLSAQLDAWWNPAGDP